MIRKPTVYWELAVVYFKAAHPEIHSEERENL